MELRKEAIKTEGWILEYFCWMHSILLASVDVIEFQTKEAYSTFDLTGVKYNMYIHVEDEKVNVTVQIRPNNLIQRQNT
jgi:hypothetical protein